MEPNDSPEIPDRGWGDGGGETSDIPGLPSRVSLVSTRDLKASHMLNCIRPIYHIGPNTNITGTGLEKCR